VIGTKDNIPNCRVLTKLAPEPEFSEETIMIHTVDQAIKIVEADTQQGAVYGLGFIQAMDRLWQLDMIRRMAYGRMSEVFGSQALGVD
jgi:penicillin amidase